MKIIKQAIKEFWLPAIVAVSWATYNIWVEDPRTTASWISFINVFGPTFFLAAWLTGQFFRIRKQARVETSLAEITQRLETVADDLAQNTQQLLANVLGGDSYCYVSVPQIDQEKNIAWLLLVNGGDYPLYDVSIRLVDLDLFEGIMRNSAGMRIEDMQKVERNIAFGNITPNTASHLCQLFLGDRQSSRYNIFFEARNGFFTQLLRLKKVKGLWHSAYKVLTISGETVLDERVDEGFPRNNDGEVDW
ncbi:MAG: hypothetical protein ACOC7K_02270 [bacterium]